MQWLAVSSRASHVTPPRVADALALALAPVTLQGHAVACYLVTCPVTSRRRRGSRTRSRSGKVVAHRQSLARTRRTLGVGEDTCRRGSRTRARARSPARRRLQSASTTVHSGLSHQNMSHNWSHRNSQAVDRSGYESVPDSLGLQSASTTVYSGSSAELPRNGLRRRRRGARAGTAAHASRAGPRSPRRKAESGPHIRVARRRGRQAPAARQSARTRGTGDQAPAPSPGRVRMLTVVAGASVY